MVNRLVPHWEAARARALTYHGLGARERDVLALVLALVAAEDGIAVEDVSLWSVRYRVADPGVWQALSAVLPGPLDHVATTVEGGQEERIRLSIDELVDDEGRYTGRADLEEVFAREIEAVVRERGGFGARAPLEGRIWRLWAALQAPHGRSYVASRTSEELDAHDAMSLPDRYVESGLTAFEHALNCLRGYLDRLLLPVCGAPPLNSPVLVTGGRHAGRSGRLDAVTWSMDAQRRVCCEPPVSYTVSFGDHHVTRGTADIAPADVRPLPEWDREFVVVHLGEQMPMEWDACVLLAGPKPDVPWQQSVITELKDRWQQVCRRLVVLVAHRADDRTASVSGGQEEWLRDACAWADEIITTRVPVSGSWDPRTPGAAAGLEGARDRLVLHVAAPDEGTLRWAAQHGVPVAATAADAAAAVLTRLGSGRRRTGGQRQVRLGVTRNPGYEAWAEALRQAGRTLDAATVDWSLPAPGCPGDVSWWAITAQVRHPDDLVTEERVVGRGDTASVVALLRHPVWTDSEVALVRHPLSLGAPPLSTVPTLFPLRLPAAFGTPGGLGVLQGQARVIPARDNELGLDIDESRLRLLDRRQESALLAAVHHVVLLELTEDERDQLTTRHTRDTGTGGAVEVHRVADLLSSSSRHSTPVDWATLGVIMRAAAPVPPRSR
ncbi:MAG TPA: hypothetical protein VIU15_32365 [Streptomyces sp.]